MLIECPECKQPVSDKAPACPHCGVVVTPGGKAVKVGSRRKATQFVWFFFWLLLAGAFYPLYSEGGDRAIGAVMTVVGIFGWAGALLYRWIYT